MRIEVRADCIGLDMFEILALIDQATPPVTHPGVVEHPYTKGNLIYGNRGFTMGIANRSLDESAALLREIFDFAETDRFVREVEWSTGDIIWDNRFLQHSSGRNLGPEEETMMYRITLQDGVPLCASQMQTKTAA
jgi:taurine dioxygenase